MSNHIEKQFADIVQDDLINVESTLTLLRVTAKVDYCSQWLNT